MFCIHSLWANNVYFKEMCRCLESLFKMLRVSEYIMKSITSCLGKISNSTLNVELWKGHCLPRDQNNNSKSITNDVMYIRLIHTNCECETTGLVQQRPLTVFIFFQYSHSGVKFCLLYYQCNQHRIVWENVTFPCTSECIYQRICIHFHFICLLHIQVPIHQILIHRYEK